MLMFLSYFLLRFHLLVSLVVVLVATATAADDRRNESNEDEPWRRVATPSFSNARGRMLRRESSPVGSRHRSNLATSTSSGKDSAAAAAALGISKGSPKGEQGTASSADDVVTSGFFVGPSSFLQVFDSSDRDDYHTHRRTQEEANLDSDHAIFADNYFNTKAKISQGHQAGQAEADTDPDARTTVNEAGKKTDGDHTYFTSAATSPSPESYVETTLGVDNGHEERASAAHDMRKAAAMVNVLERVHGSNPTALHTLESRLLQHSSGDDSAGLVLGSDSSLIRDPWLAAVPESESIRVFLYELGFDIPEAKDLTPNLSCDPEISRARQRYLVARRLTALDDEKPGQALSMDDILSHGEAANGGALALRANLKNDVDSLRERSRRGYRIPVFEEEPENGAQKKDEDDDKKSNKVKKYSWPRKMMHDAFVQFLPHRTKPLGERRREMRRIADRTILRQLRSPSQCYGASLLQHADRLYCAVFDSDIFPTFLHQKKLITVDGEEADVTGGESAAEAKISLLEVDTEQHLNVRVQQHQLRSEAADGNKAAATKGAASETATSTSREVIDPSKSTSKQQQEGAAGSKKSTTDKKGLLAKRLQSLFNRENWELFRRAALQVHGCDEKVLGSGGNVFQSQRRVLQKLRQDIKDYNTLHRMSGVKFFTLASYLDDPAFEALPKAVQSEAPTRAGLLSQEQRASYDKVRKSAMMSHTATDAEGSSHEESYFKDLPKTLDLKDNADTILTQETDILNDGTTSNVHDYADRKVQQVNSLFRGRSHPVYFCNPSVHAELCEAIAMPSVTGKDGKRHVTDVVAFTQETHADVGEIAVEVGTLERRRDVAGKVVIVPVPGGANGNDNRAAIEAALDPRSVDSDYDQDDHLHHTPVGAHHGSVILAYPKGNMPGASEQANTAGGESPGLAAWHLLQKTWQERSHMLSDADEVGPTNDNDDTRIYLPPSEVSFLQFDAFDTKSTTPAQRQNKDDLHTPPTTTTVQLAEVTNGVRYSSRESEGLTSSELVSTTDEVDDLLSNFVDIDDHVEAAASTSLAGKSTEDITKASSKAAFSSTSSSSVLELGEMKMKNDQDKQIVEDRFRVFLENNEAVLHGGDDIVDANAVASPEGLKTLFDALQSHVAKRGEDDQQTQSISREARESEEDRDENREATVQGEPSITGPRDPLPTSSSMLEMNTENKNSRAARKINTNSETQNKDSDKDKVARARLSQLVRRVLGNVAASRQSLLALLEQTHDEDTLLKASNLLNSFEALDHEMADVMRSFRR
ncbi:unnamed protein product [Amoebophrya sp. A25]|nr:unnamed protein product [Amoebophrya sp. A25]|eukprot:GSA25T00009805001.1